MGLVEKVKSARERGSSRSWPVGPGSLLSHEASTGHVSEFSPEEYGDYLAKSNEIYSAVTLRARLMAGLQLQTFHGRDSEKATIKAGPAVELLRHVNPFWTLPRLLRMDEMSMGTWGESFWAIEKRAGKPSEIWWCKASRMHPIADENDYLAGFLYEPAAGGQMIRFAPDEIVWFRYPNPIDEFAPLSPLAAARLAADTGSAMMTSNRNLFRDGLQMGGLIVPSTDKVTFSKDQAEELEHLLDRRWKGVDKAHRWAVLRYEAQMKTMGVNPKDAEFLGGLNMSLRQVANAYGIPVPLLNDMEHATLSNAREYQQILWAHALVPDADFKAAEIEEQLLPMFGSGEQVDHVAWDYTKVPALQEAATEIWDRERGQLEVGALTINEWRQARGMPAVPWGDVWWGPVNKSAVTDDQSEPQGDTAPTKLPPAPDPAPGSAPVPAPASSESVDDTARQLILSALNGHGRA